MAGDQNLITRDFLGLGSINDPGAAHTVPLSRLEVDEAFLAPRHPVLSNLKPPYGNHSHGVLGSALSAANSNASPCNMLFTGMALPTWTRDFNLQLRGQDANMLNTLCTNEQTLPAGLGGHRPSTQGTNDPLLVAPGRQWPSPGSHLAWPMLSGLQSGVPSRMPMPLSDMLEKQGSTQLTIVYDGSINVFDGISAEQARAIMNFASSGSPSVGASLHENVKPQSNPEKVIHAAANPQHEGDAVKFVNPGTNPGTPSTVLPACQPVVPTALPLARKASLARFLEKRRERVHSKSPYLISKVGHSALPAERFSSSNYASTPCEESINMMVPIPCGLEGMAEHSPNGDALTREESFGDTGN